QVAVDVGGVQVRDPGVERRLDDLARPLEIEPAAEVVAAEPDARDDEIAGAELPVEHGRQVSPSVPGPAAPRSPPGSEAAVPSAAARPRGRGRRSASRRGTRRAATPPARAGPRARGPRAGGARPTATAVGAADSPCVRPSR